jgi:hypothetical protein
VSINSAKLDSKVMMNLVEKFGKESHWLIENVACNKGNYHDIVGVEFANIIQHLEKNMKRNIKHNIHKRVLNIGCYYFHLTE